MDGGTTCVRTGRRSSCAIASSTRSSRRTTTTLESCYAPEAVIWHSHDSLYQPRADNLAMLKRGMETSTKTRFKDRRVRVFEGGFVQQHTIYVTHESGFVGQMDVCFVGYVRDGMISRAYEYFDTGQIDKFLPPRETRMTPSAEGLVERVAALTPTIAAKSFEAEAQRRPLDEVIDALKATGVFRSFVPERTAATRSTCRPTSTSGSPSPRPIRRWGGSPPSTWSTTGCSRCSPRTSRTRSSARSPSCSRPAA